MEGYISDEEQVQRIKDWWKKYGTAILLVVLVFLAANVGWKYWNRYKSQKAQKASMIYEELFDADATHKTNNVKLLADHLIKDFSDTPYSSLASLLLARNSIKSNDLKSAKQDLQWVINNSSSNGLRQIARIREARVLLAAKQYQQALNLLSVVDNMAFKSVIDETKGDVYLAMQQKDMALGAYQAALKAAGDKNVSPMLSMKLNELKR